MSALPQNELFTEVHDLKLPQQGVLGCLPYILTKLSSSVYTSPKCEDI